MKQIIYKNLKTSSLGFGCSTLARDIRSKQAEAILETAFDHGITHYDVARSYGYGRCEYIVGKFLKGRREKVTVTTKFGNTMPEPPVNHHIINALRWAMKGFPTLKAEARSAVIVRPKPANRFSISEAAKSLEASLKELKTDYIDILLLHECSLQAANDLGLIEFLDYAVRDGKIRYYGLATAFSNLPASSSDINSKHSVIQSESAPLASYSKLIGSEQKRLFIGHSIFKELNRLHKKLSTSSEIDPQEDISFNILRTAFSSGKKGLAELMLLNARHRNPDGIVIFSSTNIDNIKSNVGVWVSENQRLAEINAMNEMLGGQKNIV